MVVEPILKFLVPTVLTPVPGELAVVAPVIVHVNVVTLVVEGSGTVMDALQPAVAFPFMSPGQVIDGLVHSVTSIDCDADTGLPQPLETV